MAIVPEMTERSNPSSEEQFLQSLNSLHYMLIQQAPKYALFTSNAQENTSFAEISEATKKVYAKGTSGEQEVIALEKLRDLYEDSLPIASFITTCTSKGIHFIFVKHLEKSLEDEIGERCLYGNYWDEEELWEHMWDITRAIFKVHFVGFVHRNIAPRSLFLKRGKLYLFHFEHCKELARGQSEELATVKRTGSFLSPQAVLASKTKSGKVHGFTYKVARKDDVWGLGQTLFTMATLRLNENLENSFHLSQECFSQYICALLGTRYSTLFKNVITSFLTLNAYERPSFEDFYAWMRQYYRIGKCIDCSRRVVTLWPCEHIRCECCLEQALIHLVNARSDRLHLCPSQVKSTDPAEIFDTITCPDGIPFEFFERYRNAEKLALLIAQPIRKCHCLHNYSVLGENNKPKFITCECGLQFCSFCKSTDVHKRFGVKAKCPSFADLTRCGSS